MASHDQPRPEDLADLQSEMPDCHDAVVDQFELPDDFEAQAAELSRMELDDMPQVVPPRVEVAVPAEWEIDTQSSAVRSSAAHSVGPASLGLAVRFGGHVVFGVLGLVIGYYILCWIEPRGNFLNLPLPGIERVAPAGDRLR